MMFADAADRALNPVPSITAVDTSASHHESDKCTSEKAQELDNWLLSALENLEGIHLLPCHIKYSGQASVSDLFRPKSVKSDAANNNSSGNLEALLHGRLLRGQEQSLSGATPAAKLQGFVSAAQQTTCNLDDLRKLLSAEHQVDEIAEDSCVEVKEPPATVIALHPYAEFNKLCYWHHDREPNATDDVQQSLFFLRVTAALHDYQDEFDDS